MDLSLHYQIQHKSKRYHNQNPQLESTSRSVGQQHRNPPVHEGVGGDPALSIAPSRVVTTEPKEGPAQRPRLSTQLPAPPPPPTAPLQGGWRPSAKPNPDRDLRAYSKEYRETGVAGGCAGKTRPPAQKRTSTPKAPTPKRPDVWMILRSRVSTTARQHRHPCRPCGLKCHLAVQCPTQVGPWGNPKYGKATVARSRRGKLGEVDRKSQRSNS